MGFSHIIFDWGDTLMRDFPEKSGPMADWDKIEVLDGVVNTLPLLSEKYTLAVATNAGTSDTLLMKMALRRGLIESYFTYFFSSKDLGFSKPDPRFFLEICNQMHVETEQCIYVGNDYHKDIVGAFHSGIQAIFFNHAQRKGKMNAARTVIQTFTELIYILI